VSTLARPATPIPPLIKRNTTLFALSQSFTGAGMQFAFGLGPLMVIALTGSAALAGLSVGLIGFSRFLVSYPMGKITDTYGRKPGILLGLSLALVGTLLVGASMTIHSLTLLVVGMLVFAMGMNGSQQLRVAATDMFPPWMRAQALGYIALGSLVGLVISPLLIGLAESLAKTHGLETLALPWFMLPALIVSGMCMIGFVRPDPKEIGMNLGRYWPGYTAPPPRARPEGAAERFSGWTLLRNQPIRLAIVSNCAAQANMSIVMVLTSLVLNHHGHSLTAIAFAHTFHSAGMFAFTVPLGRLADRLGRTRVMMPGVATALVGACLVAFGSVWWAVTLGTFLVGLGWAAANVAATAMIADHVETEERGRAIGVNESASGATAVVMALVTGVLIEWSSLSATGAVAALVAIPPLVMHSAAWFRQRTARRKAADGGVETRPAP
jgi:MFS family permease